jgi:hypothetical protein
LLLLMASGYLQSGKGFHSMSTFQLATEWQGSTQAKSSENAQDSLWGHMLSLPSLFFFLNTWLGIHCTFTYVLTM